MENFWANFVLEIALFSVLGVLYYFYQRKKILHYEQNKSSIVMGMILQSCLSEKNEIDSPKLDQLISALDDFLHNRVPSPPLTLLQHYMNTTECSPELREVIDAGLKELGN